MKKIVLQAALNITHIWLIKFIANRPYTSLEDFQSKVKVNRTQMLMLLKCGAFDNLYPDRMKAIEEYLATKAATKTKTYIGECSNVDEIQCLR